MGYEVWDDERLDNILKEKHITRLTEVVGLRYKVQVRCEICSYVWEATPQTLSRSGCPQCYQASRVGKHRKAKWKLKEVADVCAELGYNLLERTYKNNKQPLTLLNKATGELFQRTFRALHDEWVASKKDK